MNTDAVIESYVGDVVKHLPRRQRNDVAYELRSLLREELEGRAADAGREADSEMTIQLLASFGRPVDVADRYRPAGFTVIRPAEAPRFAWVGLGGVAVQWVLTLVATFTAPVDPGAAGSDWLSRLGSWWLSWGLGAFWWPGFLISLTIIAAAISSRRERSGEWAPARAADLDRDRVRRPLMALTLALGVVGASIVIALPALATWGSWLPQPAIEALALDGEFLAWRAPWVLVLWAASFIVGAVVLVAGRWSRLTSRVAIALDVAWIALLIWWVAAGPIFAREAADSATKGWLFLIIALVVVDIVLGVRRTLSSIKEPVVQA